MSRGLKLLIKQMNAKLIAANIIAEALDKARAELFASGMDKDEANDVIQEIWDADVE